MPKKRRPLVLPESSERSGSDDQSVDGDHSVSTFDGSVSTLDGELRALDRQLFKMSKETDAILDSIRSEAKDNDDDDDDEYPEDMTPEATKDLSASEDEKPKRQMNETRATSFDDDDMDGELARLEVITNAIRESLDGNDSLLSSPIARPQPVSFRGPPLPATTPTSSVDQSAARKRSTKKNKKEKSPVLDKGASPLLGLSVAIVWCIVVLLVVHGRRCLIDEYGSLVPPFSCFIAAWR